MTTQFTCTGADGTFITYSTADADGRYNVPFTLIPNTAANLNVYLWDATDQEYDLIQQDDANNPWIYDPANNRVDFDGAGPAVGTATLPDGSTQGTLMLARVTDVSEDELAQFTPGSSIRSQDLNDNFNKLGNAIEELHCNATLNGEDFESFYWNKVDVDAGGDTYTSSSTSAWPSNNTTIPTTAAGDERWLNATGGDIIGGDGISADESGGAVTIAVDLDTNSGLEFDSGKLQVDDGNGIVVNATGVNVGQGTGITVNTDNVAVNQVTIWGQNHNHSGNVSGNMDDVGNINFTAGNKEIVSATNADRITISGGTGGGAEALVVNRDLELATNATIGLGGVTYDPPSADGSANQVLTTDGSGSLSWATAAASDTTYDLTATDNGTDANINLVDSDGSTDTVTIAAGTNVTVDQSGSTITINSTDTNTNTTYDLTVPASTTDIRLAGSNGTNDDITITGGTNVTVTRTSATELSIAATDTDNNTTYTLPVTASSGNAVLTLTGANPASTDPVTIKAGNNVSFSSIGADGFTINSSGGGGGGGSGANVVANCAGLNTAVTDGPPSGGDLYLVIDSSNMTAAAGTAPGNTTAINDLPETVAAGAPVGGYGGQIQVTVEWDSGNTRWQYIRWAVQEPDNRYVLEQGDTMTGNLLFNNGSDDTITLATDGSATFGSDVTSATNIYAGGEPASGQAAGARLQSTGKIYAARAGAIFEGFVPGNSTANVLINGDGSAEFGSGNIELNAGGLVQSTVTSGVNFEARKSSGGVIQLSNADGTASSQLSFSNAGKELAIFPNLVAGTGPKIKADNDNISIFGGTNNGSNQIIIDNDGDILIGGTPTSSPNISLNATDGSASFAGTLTTGGTINAANTSAAGNGLIVGNSNQIVLQANGSASFSGAVSCGSGTGTGTTFGVAGFCNQDASGQLGAVYAQNSKAGGRNWSGASSGDGAVITSEIFEDGSSKFGVNAGSSSSNTNGSNIKSTGRILLNKDDSNNESFINLTKYNAVNTGLGLLFMLMVS
jgi:hypothetical protein